MTKYFLQLFSIKHILSIEIKGNFYSFMATKLSSIPWRIIVISVEGQDVITRWTKAKLLL